MDGKENEITNGAGAADAAQAEGQASAQTSGSTGMPPVASGNDNSANDEQKSSGTGKPAIDYAAEIAKRDASITERDGKIAELEGKLADAEKLGQQAESLKTENEQMKNQAASDRIDFALQLAGCRNVKAARAVLDDYDGDVVKLKAAEPYCGR